MIKRFIPLPPGLKLRTFFNSKDKNLPFPLNQAYRAYYYTRNGIWRSAAEFGLEPEDEVLLPAYHSSSESGALEASGVKIKFYDLQPNCQVDFDSLKEQITPNTKALYLIHYFGFAQPMDKILKFCQQHNLLLLEDCAISLFSANGERNLGSYGQAAYFCLRKYLAIPNGGVLINNNVELHNSGPESLKAPSKLSTFIEFGSLVLHEWVRKLPGLYHWFAIFRDFVRNSFSGIKKSSGSSDFQLAQTSWQMARLSKYLLKRFDYDQIIKSRQDNYNYLKKKLTSLSAYPNKINFLAIEEQPGFVPFCLPLVVDDNVKWSKELEKSGIEAGAWWANDKRKAEKTHCPNSIWLRKHVLEVPIHQAMNKKDLDYIASCISGLFNK